MNECCKLVMVVEIVWTALARDRYQQITSYHFSNRFSTDIQSLQKRVVQRLNILQGARVHEVGLIKIPYCMSKLKE